MKSHPKFQQERLRLKLRLEAYKQLMQEDLHDLKESVRPAALVKNVMGQAGEKFKDNLSFSKGASLAMKLIPGTSKLGTVGRFVLPLLVRNIPRIAHLVADKKAGLKKSSVLGSLRNAVHKLRTRIKPHG